MPKQQGAGLVLDFASFYQCAVKPFKHKPQNRAVCILLLEEEPTGKLPISDAVCSNYISGKRAIPDDARLAFATITPEKVSAKLNALGILDLNSPADALKHLVEYSWIPQRTLNRLLTASTESSQLGFITEVLRVAADGKRTDALTKEEIALIGTFSSPAPSLAARSEASERDFDGTISDADLDWMSDYVPAKLLANSKTFFGTPITMSRLVLSLPRDYGALVYQIRPALRGMPFDSFSFDDFTEAMGINPAYGKMKSGKLQCWQLAGPPDGIAGAIEGFNFHEVSDVALIMRGRITLNDCRLVEQAIRAASNPNVNIIHCLCFDSRPPSVEVTLIVRKDSLRAAEERASDDGMKIYKR